MYNPNLQPQFPGVPPPGYNPLLTTMMMNQQGLMPAPNIAPKNSLVCKLYFMNEGDNRRFKIKRTTKLKGLMVHIERYLTPYAKKFGVRVDKLQYEDDEGDWMNFSSETEWIECLKLTQLKKKSRKLRVRIFTKGKQPDLPEEEEDGEEEEPVPVQKPKPKPKPKPIQKPRPVDPAPPQEEENVHDVPCTRCKMPRIVGTRYQSTTKPNVDLCSGCFQGRDESMKFDGWNVYEKKNAVRRRIEPKERPFVVPNEYKNKVKLLSEMGFRDVKRSVQLLRKHNGDLQAVVKESLAY